MIGLVEVVEKQARVIQLQSETINELFQVLSQYMEMEEVEKIPCVKRLTEEK